MKNTVASVTAQSRKLKRKAEQVAAGREKQAIKKEAARAKEQAYDQAVAASYSLVESCSVRDTDTTRIRIKIIKHDVTLGDTRFRSCIGRNVRVRAKAKSTAAVVVVELNLIFLTSPSIPITCQTSVSCRLDYAPVQQWYWITSTFFDSRANVAHGHHDRSKWGRSRSRDRSDSRQPGLRIRWNRTDRSAYKGTCRQIPAGVFI
ncbi:hypothetical protein BGX28_009102 [Mortierella sp. GBA30]|nr:hypothetical protein BGX28_009102 [Mortierella sp. GBA30]